jgi:hypothetical protein
MEFARYAQVPKQVQDDLLEAARKAREKK